MQENNGNKVQINKKEFIKELYDPPK